MYSQPELRLALATVITMVAIMVAGAFADDVYVDDNGSDPGSGTPADPYKRITDALADSDLVPGDTIYVAPGLYDVANNDERFPLTMKGGVTLHGSGSDTTTIDPGDMSGAITCNNVSGVAIRGVTITNGSADDGGAIYCNDSSPTISHCDITGNSASRGGAIYCDNWASPAFTDCVIAENSASGGGGGVYTDNNSLPSFRDCVIAHNYASGNGGGFFCDNAAQSIELTNCLIIVNSCGVNGGGMFCDSHSSVIINCTFSGNKAAQLDDDGLGGAFFMDSNCHPVVVNCIFWGDSPDEICGAAEWKNSINITYSDVQQDGFGKEGNTCEPDENHNINCEPNFRRIGLDDMPYDGYFLCHETGTESPCIDTGDPSNHPFGGASNTEYSTDHRDNDDPLIDINQVDMGYHYKRCGCTFIELVSFEARAQGLSIVLTWQTGAEIDNAGFVLYRTIAGACDYIQVSGLIAAEGTAASGASYAFTDADVEAGVSYDYWLVDIETSGKWRAHGPAPAKLPVRLELIQLPSAFARGYGGQAANAR